MTQPVLKAAEALMLELIEMDKIGAIDLDEWPNAKTLIQEVQNYDTEEHLRGFECYYLSPTTHRGTRCKIVDTRHEKSITIPWDYKRNTTFEVALDFLTDRGINIVAHTYNEKTGRHTLLTADFATQLKGESN